MARPLERVNACLRNSISDENRHGGYFWLEASGFNVEGSQIPLGLLLTFNLPTFDL
jgi:hypothetical protein